MAESRIERLVPVCFIIVIFISIASLFLLNIYEPAYDYSYLFEPVLLTLILMIYPANHFLAGTGIAVYLIFCTLMILLGMMFFSRMIYISAVPMIYILQFLAKSQSDNFAREKQKLHLEIEKLKEEKNDRRQDIDNLKHKRSQLDEQIRRFSSLRNYISKINLSLSSEHLFEMILNFVSKNLPGGDIYSIAMLNKRKKLLTSSFIIRESSQDVLLRPDKTDVFNEWVMTYRSPLRIANINEDYRFQIHGNEPLLYPLSKSIIASPLISDDKPMGLVRIDSVVADIFTANDFRLLVIIANISALSLKNAELFKETQKLSVTDGLTGLYLPHFMFDEMNRYHSSNLRRSTVLMMDLDHFKAVNDNFGHVVGDNVLMHVAKILKRLVPDSSMAVRYGGEEFAVFLPGFDTSDAFTLAEKIRKAVSEKKIVVRRETITITISIGISSFPDDATDSVELIKKADERLYLAKNRGRNLTVN